MKKSCISFLSFFLSIPLAHADFADEIAKSMFQKKIDQLYNKALSCKTIETDPRFKIDVKDWIKIQPKLPKWQMLASIENTAQDARKYAKSIGGNDKILHCLAGCYIAKRLDYSSAVIVGWMKELSDASDCSKSTSFEKMDYEVTRDGAKMASLNVECNKSCTKKNLSQVKSK